MVYFSELQVTLLGNPSEGGVSEPHFLELIDCLLKSHSNVLDIGANHGTHAMAMANICKQGQVYAFEPQNFMFQILTLNVEINQISNIKLYNLAVGLSTGEILYLESINTNRKQVNSGNTRVQTYPSIHRSITIALDDLRFPKIDFVKMDIQGFELFAFKGMQRTLLENRPFIFF